MTSCQEKKPMRILSAVLHRDEAGYFLRSLPDGRAGQKAPDPFREGLHMVFSLPRLIRFIVYRQDREQNFEQVSGVGILFPIDLRVGKKRGYPTFSGIVSPRITWNRELTYGVPGMNGARKYKKRHNAIPMLQGIILNSKIYWMIFFDFHIFTFRS
jgi:hypothetical protein